MCHRSGRRHAGGKFASQSSLESCAGLGLSPDSQQPAPAPQLPCRSRGLVPGGKRAVLCVSPVLTPVGDPVQIPPSPEPAVSGCLAGCAGCWGAHCRRRLGSLGPGSQVCPPSPWPAPLEAVTGLEGSSELFYHLGHRVLYLQVCGAGSTVGGPPAAGRCAGGLGSWVQCPRFSEP